MPTTPEKPPSRQSPSPPNKSFLPSEDSSLLLATQIPVPTDSDEEENSFDMRALSSPSRGQRPPTFDFAPASPTLPSASSDGGMVEDALFAQAAQAESAAERLNELMEPEAESPHTAPRAAPFPVVIPQTPVNRTKKSGLKQLAVFQDSPAVKATPSIMDHLYENKHETGWWLKRKTRKFRHYLYV
jgi:CLIP-associating protein 1/2